MAGQRDGWKSRTGFIIAASASAVGLGNIWKFPYVAGQNGGAAFIIIYLAIIFTVGFSVLLAEQAIGRAAQRSPAAAFRVLKGGLWPVIGYIGVLTAFLILPFYSVVGGWTVAYVWKSSPARQWTAQRLAALSAMAASPSRFMHFSWQ